MKWILSSLLIVAALMMVQAAINLSIWRYDSESLWINAIYAKKESAAENIKEPKIVFIGGSATLFGVEAEAISKNLSMPAVNLGTHAGLEIDYLLTRARRSLKHGDIAVLIPEYEHFSYHDRASFIRDKFILCCDRQYMDSLPLLAKLRTIFSATPSDIAALILNRLKNTRSNYDAATINQYGDETAHDGALGYIPAPIAINKEPEFSYITDFANWCRNNGVTLFIYWPPMVDNPVYRTPEYQAFFKSLGDGLNNITLLDKPEDNLRAHDDFYDTRYHLNIKASHDYSAGLAAALKSRLSPSAIMPPQTMQ